MVGVCDSMTPGPKGTVIAGLFLAVPGEVLGLAFRPMMRKEVTKVLASFKYLVEKGKPFQG